MKMNKKFCPLCAVHKATLAGHGRFGALRHWHFDAQLDDDKMPMSSFFPMTARSFFKANRYWFGGSIDMHAWPCCAWVRVFWKNFWATIFGPVSVGEFNHASKVSAIDSVDILFSRFDSCDSSPSLSEKEYVNRTCTL